VAPSVDGYNCPVTELPATVASHSDWPDAGGESRRAGRTVISALRRRTALIVLIVTACLAAAAVITLLKSPTYDASALLVVDQRATAPTADLNATISTGELLAAHFIKLASSPTVLDRVCTQAGGACTYTSLKDHVRTATVKGTDLLAVSVNDPNPSRAAQLANIVADQLMAEERAEIASALEPTKRYLDGELTRLQGELTSAKPQMLPVVQAAYNTAYARRAAVAEQEARLDGDLATVEGAQVPSKPADPDAKRYLLAGLAVGLVVAFLWALLADRLDNRIFDAEDLWEATQAPLVVTC